LRPDSYIGSVEKVTGNMWVIDSDSDRMIQREITYVPGFFKIVDEILVNAADNKVRPVLMDAAFMNAHCILDQRPHHEHSQSGH
jgi:DNA topoisomerase II